MGCARNQTRAQVSFTFDDINCVCSYCLYYKEYYNAQGVCLLFLVSPILAEVYFSFARHMRDKAHEPIPHTTDTYHMRYQSHCLIP